MRSLRRLAVVVLAWLCVGGLPASAQTRVSIANIIVNSSHLPLWIAQEQGLFAEHGIDAQVLTVEGDPTRRMVGDVQFGVIGIPAAILAVAAGRDLKVLLSLDTAQSTGQLVARREINTPDGLRHKRFGVNRVGAGIWIQAMLALHYLGLEPARDGIAFVEIGSAPQLAQALEDGRIDATLLDPAQSAQLRGKGYPVLLDLYAANISGIQSALVVTGAYLRERPGTVEKVVAASIEGIAFALAPQNEEIVRKALMTRMKVSEPGAAESGYRSFLSRANRKPFPSAAEIQRLQRVMAVNDPNVVNVKLADLVDDRIVRKLDDSGVIDRIYGSYTVK